MVHEELDLEAWIALFDLEEARSRARERVKERWRRSPSLLRSERDFQRQLARAGPEAGPVVEPHDLAYVVQLQRELLTGSSDAATRDAHVFVWKGGEAPDRRMTKVGGLPHWPRRRRWPATATGHPLQFLGQLSLVDSAILLGDVGGRLPGDVLMLFGQLDGPYLMSAPHLEWADSTERDLLDSDQLGSNLKACSPLKPCYGVLARVADVSEVAVDGDLESSAILEATKIGGYPYWIQPVGGASGRFFGTFGSIMAERRPGVDRTERFARLGWSPLPDGTEMLLGDMGNANLFLRRRLIVGPWTVSAMVASH